MKITHLILLLTACLVSTLSWAKDPSSTVIDDSKLIPDVRVIIDISGSMKQNDPENLRRSALELLVQLFPEGSKAGVWTFGQWVNNLVTSNAVDSQWRQSAAKQARKINSVALHTNIPAALIKAVDDIDHLDPRYQIHLILLTDGMVDISKKPAENIAAKERILKQILPKFRDAGIIIHTVALSKNADQQLMERLALETGGLFVVAETAEDLTNIFLQTFDAAVPAEQVPLEGNTFLVDSSIEEFTALIFRKPNSQASILISPDNKQSSLAQHGADVKWFQQQNYDLITVQHPYEGEWRIDAELEPNSRVTIVSNLSLQVSALAKSIFIGDEQSLSVALIEQGEVISRTEFLKMVDVSVSVVRRDDSASWPLSLSESKPTPADGRFYTELGMLQEAGIYDISTLVDGKTFQRKQRQTVAVREAFQITANSIDGDIPNHELMLFARDASVDTDATKVTAILELPDGNQQQILMVAKGDRSWQLLIDGINQSGYYQVSFQINGSKTNGEAVIHTTRTITIEHQVVGSDFIDLPVDKEPTIIKETDLAEETPKPETVAEPEEIVELEQPQAIKKEVKVKEGTDWKQISIYVGVAISNLLVLVLGFVAYKTIKGNRNKSSVLDDDDEDFQDEALAEDLQAEPELELDELDQITDEEQESVDVEPATDSQEVGDDKNTESSSTAKSVESENTETEIDIDIDIDIDTEPDNDLETELGNIGEVDIDEEDLDIDLGEGETEENITDDIDEILDLPDDAIDIDPADDDEKK